MYPLKRFWTFLKCKIDVLSSKKKLCSLSYCFALRQNSCKSGLISGGGGGAPWLGLHSCKDSDKSKTNKQPISSSLVNNAGYILGASSYADQVFTLPEGIQLPRRQKAYNYPDVPLQETRSLASILAAFQINPPQLP